MAATRSKSKKPPVGAARPSRSNVPKTPAGAARPSKSNVPKRKKAGARKTVSRAANRNKLAKVGKETCSYLPEELWECIFKSLNGDRLTFKSLSIVSKQFLSITNRLRFSATITDETIPFLVRLFHRFPNLTSLDLTRLSRACHLDSLLTQISSFPIQLRALSCNNIAPNGFRALSKTMKTINSFTCSRMSTIYKNDLFLIAHCFPLLEELKLTYPRSTRDCDFVIDDDEFLPLPKLQKIDLSGIYILNAESIYRLCKNCHLLQEVILVDCFLWRQLYEMLGRL